MSLVSLRNLSFTWGHPPLLEAIDLEIEKGERIGLVGRNGAGKSTLLKILAGKIVPDTGEIRVSRGVGVAYLVQEVPSGRAEALTIAELAELTCKEQIASAQGQAADDWKIQQSVERILTRMNLPGDAPFAQLSSGMKRRALLAAALASDPQVLLLDEPTNHLDIESIAWLEQFLKGYDTSLVFVTHDRVFLQALANRIVEVDRGRLFDWTCDYATFLKRKEAALEAEEKQNALFDKKLAEEEVWIRKGIKARRTRNEGRVRALKELREERKDRRNRVGNVRLQIGEAEKSGRLVIEAKNLSFSYPDKKVVDDFSTLISRGDKLGIIGPNGTGKTTLLKLLLGELKPDSGTIRHGARLETAYFDQLREQLNEEQTLVENVGEGQDTVEINGKKQHIYSYLQDFLFTPERARRPIKFLSGGERNRLLLARLFKRPSNVMILDEPTNDLDLETLELLEELVAGYAGTLLLVSHDREFLNNVVTSVFAFEGDGKIKEYVGGYDDYLRQRDHAAAAALPKQEDKPAKATPPPASRPAKLSYKERQELQALPHRIEELETEQGALHALMSDPAYFKQDPATITQASARLQEIEGELSVLFERWESLESRDS